MEDLVSSVASTYSGKRVLITGHTGFKGAWLSTWLDRMGAEVHGLSVDVPTSPSLYMELGLEAVVVNYECDVRDTAAVRHVVESVAPEIVFHLAAYPLVRQSYKDPLATVDVNVRGSAVLLDCLRTSFSGTPIVIVSTDKVYDTSGWKFGHREDDRLGGHDPYSASKSAMELVVDSFRQSYGMNLATARAGNVVGGGDWAEDRLIPDLIRALTAGRPLLVRNPYAIRPWQHVLDALFGYLLLGARLVQGDPVAEAWNFGPSPPDHTVGQVIDTALARWGSGEWRIDGVEGHAFEQPTLRLSTEKARTLLNWLPVWGFYDAIGETIDWYRDRLQGSDLFAVTIDCIARFEVAALGRYNALKVLGPAQIRPS